MTDFYRIEEFRGLRKSEQLPLPDRQVSDHPGRFCR
jgi:hypothetical protein